MTLIRGDAGWIVVDPLTTRETASAAWDFAMQHLDPGPVSAIIYTHSHIDLFVRMLTGLAGLRETLFSDQLAVSGSRVDLLAFLMLFDRPDGNFNVVVP